VADATAEAVGEGGDEEEYDGEAEMDRNRAGDLRSESAEESAARTGGSQRTADADGAEGGTVDAVGGGGRAARRIPSGEDDDIIARRLRRAAEAETDPELKQKLWDEYIDYKENTRGG
jgi:hypothetical protein